MAQRGRPRKIEEIKPVQTYFDKLNNEIQSNQSKLSMVLGGLIILVFGILLFNYFNKGRSSLGPAQQTDQSQQEKQNAANLIDKYTVKEGDTLFTIAEKYYQDGTKFEDIAKANNLSDVNLIETGQSLAIPKIETSAPSPESKIESSLPLETSPPTPTQATPQQNNSPSPDTEWGNKISENTYTVQEGDWLSKIAGRTYGDIFEYQKIAEANNIPNPDYILPGQVLTIPR